MRGAVLLVIAGVLLLPTARAQEFVETPDGRRVRLEVYWVGVPYAAPNSSDVPVQQYTYYRDAEGREVLHGRYSRSYHTGRDVEYTTYAHGMKHGPFVSLGPDHRLQSRGNYRDGQLEGEVTWFFPNGRAKRTEQYRRGVLNGPYATFYEDGGPKSRGTFLDGVKQGPTVALHPGGELAFEGTYRDGYLSGTVRMFDEQGRKRAEGTLEQEWIVGEWRCFGADGTLVAVKTACDGEYYDRCPCP